MLKPATLIIFLLISTGDVCSQVIPSNKTVNWSLAGLSIPKPVYTNIRIITNYGGSGNGVVPNDSALQAAILSLNNDSGIIYFPGGNYLFTSPITLRSGLILRGEDASSATLQFNLGGKNQAINIRGFISGDTATLIAAANKNELSISVDNTAKFEVGGYVKIYQNDTALLTATVAANSVGQVLKITNINANNITFSSPLRKGYRLQDQPRLKRLQMIKGVGIECLRIKRLDPALNGAQISNVYMNAAADCWMTGVESDTTNFTHVHLANSTNIEISGCYFHASFGYGPNGQGYGVLLERTTGECLVENNIFRKLRHAMVLQTGANGNVIAYNYSREAYKSEGTPANLSGDILLHGNYPYANLIEGNIAENITIDASHKTNGPYNTFFRNRATLYGILMSSGAGDSTSLVGNEITSSSFGQGNYIITGTGNFEYGNNRLGVIIPAGTVSLPDASYYSASVPKFWNVASSWPSIGIAAMIGAGTIPAKARYDEGISLTTCAPRYTYTFTGSGDWNNVLNWERGLVPPTNITSGIEIVIDPIDNGSCSVTGTIQVKKYGRITVKQGKHLDIKNPE